MTIQDAISICYSTQLSTLSRTGENASVSVAQEERIYDELFADLHREPTDDEINEMAEYYEAQARDRSESM